MSHRSIAAFVVGAAVLTGGCARKEYVRGSQEPGIDSAAMSTGLDKQDIQQMLKENLDNLRTAPAMDTWRQGRGKTVVTIFPFSNETSEHIESQLQAILSETDKTRSSPTSRAPRARCSIPPTWPSTASSSEPSIS